MCACGGRSRRCRRCIARAGATRDQSVVAGSSPEAVDAPQSNFAHRVDLGRRTVAERGVTTLPVIEHFDPFENVLACFIPREIALMMHELDLERVKEAFHYRIVPAVAFAAHRAV